MDTRPQGHADAGSPPTPLGVTSVDDLIGQLRALRRWAGQPSYAEIAERIRRRRAADGTPAGAQRVSRTTVYDVFRLGRTRLDVDLLVEVVRACSASDEQAELWRRMYGTVVEQADPVWLVDARTSVPLPEAHFTSRDELVDRLVSAATGTTSVLAGLAGVGKTQVALRVVSVLAAAGESPQLLVSLGGGDRRHANASSASVLRAVLRAVDVSDSSLRNLTNEERSRIWLAWTRQHSPVVVFDDAADASQLEYVVRPDHGGRLLVTSRRSLPEIAHADAVTVEPFTNAEAARYLSRMSGASDAAAGDAIGRLAQLCGCLPLELTVVGRHIAERPGWTLDDHVRRLEKLPRGSSVAPALTAMTDDLDPVSSVVLRRLALHPGPHIAAWSAAALADRPPSAIEPTLDALASMHLLRSATVTGCDPTRRHEVHDLVRDHATNQLRDEDPHSVQRDAVQRLILRAITMTRVAVELARPGTTPDVAIDVGEATPDGVVPSSPESAITWLSVERLALVELVEMAARFDLFAESGALALSVTPYLTYIDDVPMTLRVLERGLVTPVLAVRAGLHRDLASAQMSRGHFDSAARHLEQAIATAPDPTPGRTHSLLAGLYSGTGRFAEALALYEESRDLAASVGDERRRIRQLANVGNALRLLARYDEAESALRETMDGAERGGDTIAVIFSWSTLGLVFEDTRRYTEALEYFARATALAGSIDSDFLLGQNLARIAAIHRGLGDVPLALDYVHQAIDVSRQSGEDNSEAEARVVLGEILTASGRHREAIDELRAALDQARSLGAAVAEISALESLGQATLAIGDLESAAAHFGSALACAERSGDRLQVARCHRGLALTATAGEDPDLADVHARMALELFDEFSPTEAAELRDRMSA